MEGLASTLAGRRGVEGWDIKTRFHFRSSVSPDWAGIPDIGYYANFRASDDMDEPQGLDEGYDCNIIHDALGISHVLRRLKGQLPMTNHRNCSDWR